MAEKPVGENKRNGVIGASNNGGKYRRRPRRKPAAGGWLSRNHGINESGAGSSSAASGKARRVAAPAISSIRQQHGKWRQNCSALWRKTGEISEGNNRSNQ
jgi:hypothetical protein